jgi:predicted AAA+ superfamily ATPase
VVLTGARQVGKTTLAQAAYPETRYLSLDAIETRATLNGLPAGRWATAVGSAVLDEAQKAPAVFEKLKFAYDRGDVDFSILLGSAQIMMLRSVSETLAGRVLLYELWPLTLAELAADSTTPPLPLFVRLATVADPVGELGGVPTRLPQDTLVLQAASDHLAAWGGMPALLPLADERRRDWLSSYQDTYLRRDLGDLARLSDLEPFHRFQRLAALRSACIVSYAELARDAGASPATARHYLEYLRLSYQVFFLQPFRASRAASTVKAPKLFWSDVGLMRQLSANWGPMTGPVFETLVVSEAMKLLRTIAPTAEAFYHRTYGGSEVDLVVVTPHGVLAFEAKSRSSWAARDFSALRRFAVDVGDRFLAGVVVTGWDRAGVTGEPQVEQVDDDPPLWAVPFHRLFS